MTTLRGIAGGDAAPAPRPASELTAGRWLCALFRRPPRSGAVAARRPHCPHPARPHMTDRAAPALRAGSAHPSAAHLPALADPPRALGVLGLAPDRRHAVRVRKLVPLGAGLTGELGVAGDLRTGEVVRHAALTYNVRGERGVVGVRRVPGLDGGRRAPTPAVAAGATPRTLPPTPTPHPRSNPRAVPWPSCASPAPALSRRRARFACRSQAHRSCSASWPAPTRTGAPCLAWTSTTYRRRRSSRRRRCRRSRQGGR